MPTSRKRLRDSADITGAPSRARAAPASSSISRCARRTDFVTFRNQDVGGRGGIERVAGRRANGSWDTQKWLVGKIGGASRRPASSWPTALAAEKVLGQLGSVPRHLGGDRFVAKPRRKIPAGEKPTPAMRRAQLANIKKAQAAVRKRRRTRA